MRDDHARGGSRVRTVTIEFRVLGPPEVSVSEKHSIPVSQHLWGVLASFLMTPNIPVPVDVLIDRQWGARPPEKARATMRTYVCRIGQSLKLAAEGAVSIRRHPGGYALEVDQEAVDLHRFRSLRRQAEAVADSGDSDHASLLLRQAYALWRGPALATLDGDWITRIREMLEEERRAIIVQRIETDLELGRHTELLGELGQLSDEFPFDEALAQHRMIALFRSGRQADALHVFREMRERLVDQGIEPGAQLAELHQLILRHDRQLAITPAYRQTAHACQPNTLPPGIDDFVGRADEMRMLTTGSQLSNSVLVHIIEGMGGVGKTALAVRAANQLIDRYPDAQLYLSFHADYAPDAELDSDDAVSRLLRMLEIPAERIPIVPRERARLWQAELLRRRVVIILDDVSCPEQIRQIVPSGGDCLIIVASRRRRADWPPHRLLTLHPLTADEAVTLITRIIGPGAEHEPGQVAKAARLCGHLPLAIRVAAGRLRNRRLSGLGELLDELAHLSSGQRNVSETGRQIISAFESCYRQLTVGQQRFFRCLGICPCSDITLDTAMALTGSALGVADSSIGALLQHHLLEHVSVDRFRFHDIIRAYAASRCAQDDSESERRYAISRLIDHYLLAMDRANQILFTPLRAAAETESGIARHAIATNDTEAARMWLESEWRNILLIARYAGRHEWKQQCADLTHALAQFLETGGYWNDALPAHSMALNVCQDLDDLARTARAAFDLSFISLRTGHHEAAEQHAVSAMTIYRSLGDRRGHAAALDRLGLIYRNSSRLRDALAHHQEAIDIYRGIGDLHGLADSVVHAGSAYGSLGRYAEETSCLNQALDLYRHVGNKRGEAITLNNLGAVQDDQGRHRDAMENYQKSLTIFQHISERQNLAIVPHNMGRILQYKGNYEDAIIIYREVLGTYRAIGDLQHQAMALDDIGSAFGYMESYSESLVHHEKAAALAEDIGDLCLHAVAVCGIADAYCGSGSYSAALEHYGRARRLAGEIESPYLKARALYGTAETLLRTRGHEAARIYWREALDIFEQLGVPEAATVELRLNGLNTSASLRRVLCRGVLSRLLDDAAGTHLV